MNESRSLLDAIVDAIIDGRAPTVTVLDVPPISLNAARHGTLSGYLQGCKCNACGTRGRTYHRNYNRDRRASARAV